MDLKSIQDKLESLSQSLRPVIKKELPETIFHSLEVLARCIYQKLVTEHYYKDYGEILYQNIVKLHNIDNVFVYDYYYKVGAIGVIDINISFTYLDKSYIWFYTLESPDKYSQYILNTKENFQERYSSTPHNWYQDQNK